jgi:hypothetical protein
MWGSVRREPVLQRLLNKHAELFAMHGRNSLGIHHQLVDLQGKTFHRCTAAK